MAVAVPITFGTQAILIGDGADPEVFAMPCGLTSLGRSTNKNVSDTVLPDCDDPDAIAEIVNDVVSQQIRLTGSGILDNNYLPTWRAWDEDGSAKNVRWKTVGGYYQGPAKLVNYSESGELGNRWTVDVEIAFQGKPAFTAE